MKVVTDVVIIGAGVMGCSAAFYLAQTSKLRVTVIEKGPIAAGMTKRSGGMVRTHFAHEGLARLALASLRTFQNWQEIVGGSCGLVRTGFAVLTHGRANAARLEYEVQKLQEFGVNTRSIPVQELLELDPALKLDDVTCAAYEPESGFVDPVAANQAFAARAKDKGVTFRTGTLVKSILVDRGRVLGVDTTTGEIESPIVVVMAGPWSDRLLKPLGAAIGIRPERAQVVFYERPPALKSGHIAVLDEITGAYFRPHTFGLTLGGLSMPEREVVTNLDHLDETIPSAFIADVQSRIAARLPAMASAKFVRGHPGVYDTTNDDLPVLDRVPGMPGLIIGAGFSGVGLALAPAVGACIAELITDGAASTVDLRPFNYARLEPKS